MKNYLLTLLISVSLVACNSSSSIGKDETTNSPAGKETGNNLISFKVNGEQVNSSGWTISRFTWSSDPGHEWLNITSNMKEDKRTINVNIDGARPGTYNFVEGTSLKKGSHGSFYPDYLNDLGRTFSFSKGAFTITSLDVQKLTVSATFAGTVKNLKGETLVITDGKIINGALNPDVIHY